LTAFVRQDKHNIRIALFIDGLDEFEGLDNDIASLFIAAADTPNFKVCGSSRSHVAFESAFASKPSLRLQDLTHNDIRMYVEERLNENERMQYYQLLEPTECQQLIEEIVASANGVFLWVYLVVTSLSRGLGNADKISDLRRKLRLLPQDLKQFYIHILTTVDEDYKEEAVDFFLLLNATIPLDADWREFAISKKCSQEPFEDVQQMKIVAICLAEEPEETLPALLDLFITLPASLQDRCKVVSRRLRSRTGGLIDVQLRGVRLENVSPWTEVEYFHQTVQEFLYSHELKEVIRGKHNLEADYAMLKACVFELRLSERVHEVPKDRYDKLLNSAFLYARRIQNRYPQTCSPLHLLEDIYKEPLRRREEERGSINTFQEDKYYEEFVRRAVRYGIHRFIRERATDTRIFTSAFKRELLCIALGLTKNSAILCPSLILALLIVGADPFASDSDPLRSVYGIGEAVEIHRLVAFQSVITHIWTENKKGNVREQSSQNWAQILRYFLTPRYPSMWRQKPPQICDNFLEASEVISHRFQFLPDVNAELQDLLVVASYELGYENIHDSPHVPSMWTNHLVRRNWGILFWVIWYCSCLLLVCISVFYFSAVTNKHGHYEALVNICPKRSI